MFVRRFLIPVVLLLTLLLQFVPGTVFAPAPAAASTCDSAQFIADVTIPDGSSLAPGATFVKTWRLKNVGTCTWTTSYAAVFTGGDQMGAPAVVNMPSSVAPGATVDISVNMTAPAGPGHYRGNWKLRNGTGGLFGVGAGDYLFWVDIFVNSSYTSGTIYDFVANSCSAAWSSGAGALPCPGTDGDTRGFVLNASNPQLENGSASPTPGLIVNPQYVAGGYIQGVYPAFTVQSGDRFQSLINCAYNSPSCYVNFRLNYQIGSGPVQTLWSFNERYEGLYYRTNLDLSSLAGQSVKFILYVADVSGHGTPAGDRAEWVETKIARAGAGPVPPIPPSYTCDLGAFVGDVTIPDGSTVPAGSAFTKTWRIRNVGSCTWTTSYALVYVFGDPFGAAPVINLPSSVAPVTPGATADFSINMVAPSVPGHYRSYWRFRNASGTQFGVGSGMITFFADINVVTGGPGPNPTTTTILADTPDPSTPGQAVAVSVSVAGASITPTGTVSITGADTNCTITLSGGSGSCNVVFNTASAKLLTAVYSGDFAYTSSSDTENHIVGPGSTSASTTTITTDAPDASTPGQAVSVSATVSGAGLTPTGWVVITGADTNCTITLSGGSGSCTVVFNTAGARTLAAVYGGDASYATSSDTENHTVSKGSSTTTITADTPDPSAPGGSVGVSVSVTGAGVAPTGTVSITGADTNCTITLSGGTGSCNVVFNTMSAKILTATYNGDLNYNVSSDTENHLVSTATTPSTTKITSDTPDPTSPGALVAVSVSVSGSGTIPTGTVDITGADTNCSITLAGGNGTCNVIFNTAGTRTLTALYNGSANYIGSSDTEEHTVTTGLTASGTTIVSTVPDPSQPGETVVLNVAVSGAGIPKPSGTVAITGADTACNILLAADGTGNCPVTFNGAGHKNLTATYSGDGTYAPSTGNTSHTVRQGSTTTLITGHTPEPSIPGQAVTVSFSVIGGGYTPTGTVTITGADINCSITLSGGTGSCNVVFNTIGDKPIKATYSGDINYLGSEDNKNHIVNNPTTTVITSDNNDASVVGEYVTVIVKVSGLGTATPAGNVAITGADYNCTDYSPNTIGIGIGEWSCSVRFDTAYARTITATYSGDGNYAGSSDTEGHMVNKGILTEFTVTADNPDPSAPNQLVQESVFVQGAGAMPTGTVVITINSGQSSTCTIHLVGGGGTCNITFDAPGPYTITYTYSGDGNYWPKIITDDHTVSTL